MRSARGIASMAAGVPTAYGVKSRTFGPEYTAPKPLDPDCARSSRRPSPCGIASGVAQLPYPHRPDYTLLEEKMRSS
jgi:hypothetical protein